MLAVSNAYCLKTKKNQFANFDFLIGLLWKISVRLFSMFFICYDEFYEKVCF